MCPRNVSAFRVVFALLSLLLVTGCMVRQIPAPAVSPPASTAKLASMGFTIQVGAFAEVENAARLVKRLNNDHLEAYYFLYRQGLYKVRFGNFSTRVLASREAEILRGMGVIGPYYVVRPDEYVIARRPGSDEPYLRDQIVKTARRFIGVPYQWGGVSAEEGFDCSGLAMAIYRLNGLNLPRTSVQQYGAGTSISREDLAKGDLIFFDTQLRGVVSHVGVYVGEDRFIHAPRSGRTVRSGSLSNAYYQRRYVGAKTYL